MEPIALKSVSAIPGTAVRSAIEAPGPSAPGFGELLKHAVTRVNQMQTDAMHLQDAVAKGESVDIHQAIIAGEKAGLSFRLMTQVRNKLVGAYEEIMRMQV